MVGRRNDATALTRLRTAAAMLAVLLVCVFWESEAGATFRYGDIQLSGNLQTQNLFRIQNGSETFSAFNPVQQRNTFRLQYEHQMAKGGKLLDSTLTLPYIDSLNFFAYYRFVYDSIYDIAPGPTLNTQGGAIGGKIGDVRNGDRNDVAFENVLREVFLDIKTTSPVSFRIGRQQVVWGEALNFRALDSVNALDLSWHLVFEAGLFGKVGFDELREPAWTIKMLTDLGSLGPLSNQYFEAFDIPFDFQPAYVRFLPAPWSVPLRNPFRAGLVLDAGALAGGPADTLLVQPCFDYTGNPENNSDAAANGHTVDFSNSAATGTCNSANLQRSSIRQGIYKRRDPMDVNQVGARYGANALGIGFTLNYMYRRSLGADIPGSAVAKAQFGRVNATSTSSLSYVQFDNPPLAGTHETCDQTTRQCRNVNGYLRVPIEFYYPYVHVAGVSMNYFEEFTGAVWAAEAAYTFGMPVSTQDQLSNGLEKRDVMLGAVSFDRPTWIRFLNPRSTWLIVGQLNFNWIRNHGALRQIGTIPGTVVPNVDGDVGAPSVALIPGQFDEGNRIDEMKELELLSLLVASTFYRGGSFVPAIAIISDWANAPSVTAIVGFDFLPTNNVIVTPTLRIFSNFGRTVDEPWGPGRSSQNDEFQLKFTYQF